jgi:hypothetical protein
VVAVFLLALAARIAFLFLSDQPLLYTHQYQYFTNALRIAEAPDPISYVLRSDDWRVWDQHWTIAPLYFLFAGSVFKLFGAHLLMLRLIQVVLDCVVAVAVAALGRRVAGARGAWAGIAYGLYWPAIEMPTWTLTENVHTPLFVCAVTVLVRGAGELTRRRALVGGALFGLSALTRSVSSAFVLVAGLWRLLVEGRRGVVVSGLLVAGGAAVILPWTARNVFLIGEPVLIESAAFENIWWANSFVDQARFRRQQDVVHGQPTPAAKRAAALEFALRGIRRHPDLFIDKVRRNFWHFLRAEGLHNLLVVQRTLEPWRDAGNVLLDDLLFLAAVPLFVVFVLAGRPSPARGLILLWCAYYLFMIVVVFHNEIRYRSAFVPFLFAGAAGGVAALADRQRRGVLLWLGAGLGGYVSAAALWPFVAPARRALAAETALRPAFQAVDRGDLAEADQLATQAAGIDPRSPRPWQDYGRHLVLSGHVVEAAAAYKRADGLAGPGNWRSVVALPLLLQEAGHEDAPNALRRADLLSWNTDPWLVLEAAWRELPPPVTNEIRVGDGDYGAVRGFLHPRGLDPRISAPRLEWAKYDEGAVPPGTHRWSRAHAWLRLRPPQPAAAYEVTLYMGVPFPSTLQSPTVLLQADSVRGTGSPAVARFVLTDEVHPYVLRLTVPAGEPLLVSLSAPTWSRVGEPADQGVRVDRLTVNAAP